MYFEPAAAGAAPTAVIAVVALVVSVLSAAFTGWQAVTAHLNRSARRAVRLELIGTTGRSDSDARWLVNNLGEGTATGIQLEVTVRGVVDEVPTITFSGEVVGALHGKSAASVREVGRTWPGPMNRYRDYPEVRVWEGAVVHARWVDGAGRRRSRRITVRLPIDPARSGEG